VGLGSHVKCVVEEDPDIVRLAIVMVSLLQITCPVQLLVRAKYLGNGGCWDIELEDLCVCILEHLVLETWDRSAGGDGPHGGCKVHADNMALVRLVRVVGGVVIREPHGGNHPVRGVDDPGPCVGVVSHFQVRSTDIIHSI
jgi:hypothetical protein